LKATDSAAFTIPTIVDRAYIGNNNGGASISFYGDMCDVGSSAAQWGATERAMYHAGYTFDQILPQSINNYWPLIGGVSPEANLWDANGAGAVTGAAVSANPPLIFPRRRSFYVVRRRPAARRRVPGRARVSGLRPVWVLRRRRRQRRRRVSAPPLPPARSPWRPLRAWRLRRARGRRRAWARQPLRRSRQHPASAPP
jgi:hypothetical protein